MSDLRHILFCLLRVALLLSPATMAVMTFIWLVHADERRPVDTMATASIVRR